MDGSTYTVRKHAVQYYKYFTSIGMLLICMSKTPKVLQHFIKTVKTVNWKNHLYAGAYVFFGLWMINRHLSLVIDIHSQGIYHLSSRKQPVAWILLCDSLEQTRLLVLKLIMALKSMRSPSSSSVDDSTATLK